MNMVVPTVVGGNDDIVPIGGNKYRSLLNGVKIQHIKEQRLAGKK